MGCSPSASQPPAPEFPNKTNDNVYVTVSVKNPSQCCLATDVQTLNGCDSSRVEYIKNPIRGSSEKTEDARQGSCVIKVDELSNTEKSCNQTTTYDIDTTETTKSKKISLVSDVINDRSASTKKERYCLPQRAFNNERPSSSPENNCESKDNHVHPAQPASSQKMNDCKEGAEEKRETQEDGRSDEPWTVNTFASGTQLPVLKYVNCTETLPCLRGYGRSKWPIRVFAPLDYNVNAGDGGCAALIQCSNAYGSAGSDTTSQIFLFRAGFDSNHMGWRCLVSGHAGHFSDKPDFKTDEHGRLIPSCMFGSNHVSLLSNDARYGDLSHGVLVEHPEGGTSQLPVNVNGGRGDQHGGGNTLVLCSGWEPGQSDAKFIRAVYMIRSGHKDNHLQTYLLKGEDRWKFSASDNGTLLVSRSGRSVYAIYSNRDDSKMDQSNSLGQLTQTYKADTPTGLLKTLHSNMNCVMLVLCSHNDSVEDGTAAALYMVSVTSDTITSIYIDGLIGSTYGRDTADLWTFQLTDNCITVVGPHGSCRYAFISNLPAVDTTLTSNFNCLATGEENLVRGVVLISKSDIIGWVSKPSDIQVRVDERICMKFKASELIEFEGKYVFQSDWIEDAKSTGLHLVRVHAVRMHIENGSKQHIELDGSPYQLIYQPPGVVYAVNCGGQACQTVNDVVYTSEFSQFVNFSYDHVFGSRCLALGGIKRYAQIPHLISSTNDGFIYVTYRTTNVEGKDLQLLDYQVKDLPNGEMTLRLHSVDPKLGTIHIGGQLLHSKNMHPVGKSTITQTGLVAHVLDVPLTVMGNTLHLKAQNQNLCAFALLDKTYQEKKTTANESTMYSQEQQMLADKAEPLARSMTRKERKIVGWSQNLLNNASGEAGDLSHWNVSGSWKVMDGGYETEKAFVTSHMACTKYQELDLTEHFSPQYLDTSPQIKVSEWYKEGVCGGGFYSFEACVMTADGTVIDQYKSGETGRIYRDGKWTQEKVIFHNYKSGVRRVSLQSYGKDDKFWAGHYGTIISNAVIRVKRESQPDPSDSFTDIFQVDISSMSTRSSLRDGLITRVLTDNADLFEELTQEQELDPELHKQIKMELRPANKGRRRKKREIRVFVSSTLRDFRTEREQLIKKTFREVNGVCADRGVFFTYVDLRWGITDDQKLHGQTIAICLQEIARCRPYFICLMGSRFGWCQQQGQPDKVLNQSFDYAVDNYPKELGWVDSYRFDTSITQLEIMHAVLNDVAGGRDRSFFYLREHSTTKTLAEKNPKAFDSESEWHRAKQLALRARVEKREELKTRTYGKVEEVCHLVKQDLCRSIEEDFPKGTELSPLDREREAHLAFADARRRVYIGREDYFTQINSYFSEQNAQPLVIVGESGSGKSALVANWTLRVEEKELDTFLFVHFIGSSAESASHVKLLRRLYAEMKKYFNLDLAIPSSDGNLIRDLPMWLKMAGARAKCILVFDALNQLDDGTGTEGSEQDLLWLPDDLPPGMNMLLSTIPGEISQTGKIAQWPSMAVKSLNVAEKNRIVTDYLEVIYGKTLNEEQKQMIVETPQTDNPLYLKALLDEVRVFGSYRNLTDKILEYLSASNAGDLFAKILERLEVDFEKGQNETSTLVRRTTSAIWCSHRGMAEAELLEILEVPRTVWSPFYLSLVENLVNRNGVLNFFHDHLRQAVENRYIPSSEDKRRGYKQLADFFSSRNIDDRAVDELPFLLAKAGEFDRLRETITLLEVFRRLVKTEDGKFDLIKYWNMLGGFSQVEQLYTEALARLPEPSTEFEQDSHSDLQRDLAEFFMDLGLLSAARSMFENLLKNLETKNKLSDGTVVYNPFDHSRIYRCKHPAVLDLLHKLGTVCEKQKEFQSALGYYQDAISRQNRVKTPAQKLQLAKGLLGQATVLYLMTDMKEAKKFLLRAREVATDVLGPRHHVVAGIINKLGQLSYKQGRLDEALGYFMQDLHLTRGEDGTSHPRVAHILQDIALVYDDKGELLAGELYEAALTILLDTYGSAHLDVAVTRYNLGAFYFANNSFSKAKFQFLEASNIYNNFLGPDHPDTVETLQALDDLSSFVT